MDAVAELTVVEFLPSKGGPGFVTVFSKDTDVEHLRGVAVIHMDADPERQIVSRLGRNGVKFLSPGERTRYMLSDGRTWLDYWSKDGQAD